MIEKQWEILGKTSWLLFLVVTNTKILIQNKYKFKYLSGISSISYFVFWKKLSSQSAPFLVTWNSPMGWTHHFAQRFCFCQLNWLDFSQRLLHFVLPAINQWLKNAILDWIAYVQLGWKWKPLKELMISTFQAVICVGHMKGREGRNQELARSSGLESPYTSSLVFLYWQTNDTPNEAC